MKLGKKKLLWMHLDETKLPAASGQAWELFATSMIGGSVPIGSKKLVKNPKVHWEI
jgi:hypothetical protein